MANNRTARVDCTALKWEPNKFKGTQIDEFYTQIKNLTVTACIMYKIHLFCILVEIVFNSFDSYVFYTKISQMFTCAKIHMTMQQMKWNKFLFLWLQKRSITWTRFGHMQFWNGNHSLSALHINVLHIWCTDHTSLCVRCAFVYVQR